MIASMYLEFKYPVKDYFLTLDKKEIRYEWILPFFLGAFLFVLISYIGIDLDYGSFAKYVVGLLAILIGFSITSLTVLSTASGEAIEKLKKKKTKRHIGTQEINAYRLMHVTFTFGLIMEIVVVVLISISYIFVKLVDITVCKNIILSFQAFLLMHIILLNIRNITNFYLVFSASNE